MDKFEEYKEGWVKNRKKGKRDVRKGKNLRRTRKYGGERRTERQET